MNDKIWYSVKCKIKNKNQKNKKLEIMKKNEE